MTYRIIIALMNQVQADRLILHLARNSRIDPDETMHQQLHRYYAPSFFSENLYPVDTLRGRIYRVINSIRGERHTQKQVIDLFQKAIAQSTQQLVHPHLIRLVAEKTPTTAVSSVTDWENPSITGLENHRHELQERDKETRKTFSLLQPQCLRTHLAAMLQELPETMPLLNKLKTLIPSLSFHPNNLSDHMDAAEIIQGWLDDPSLETYRSHLTSMHQLILSPVDSLDHDTFRSIVLGPNPTMSGRGYWQRWLEKHPKWAHPNGSKVEPLYTKALERHQSILSRLGTHATADAKNQFLAEIISAEISDEVEALAPGTSLLLKESFGTRVPSVQRLFQLLQQLPSEILSGLPEFLKKQVLYDEPNRYSAQLIRHWIEENSSTASLSPEQRLLLLSLLEDTDKPPPDLLLNRLEAWLPRPFHLLVRWFYRLIEPLWKNGIISAYENLDRAIPSSKVLEELSLLCTAPAISNDIAVGCCYYAFSLLAFLPRGKVIDVLTWIRENIQRFTDPHLRPTALKDLETLTEKLADKPIQSILAPMMDTINEALHIFYKDIVTPAIALPFVQMTGIEYPFLSAPFWITITRQDNNSYTVQIYGSGHSLYYFQRAEEGIKWPRVIGNIPRERLNHTFIRRILDHTYRATFDTAFASASEDLFGEGATFDTLTSDVDFRRTAEAELQSIFINGDSHTYQEVRTFTRVIDTEWELYQSATTKRDPHYIGLHFHFDALINYCQQFYDEDSSSLDFRRDPQAISVLQSALRQIEQEFLRHEQELTHEEQLCIRTTLRDVHISLSAAIGPQIKTAGTNGIPVSVITAFRRTMDLFGVEPRSILQHRHTISWLFGSHVGEAAAYILTEASRAEGITLDDVEATALSDLSEQIKTISTLTYDEKQFRLQAETLYAHLKQRIDRFNRTTTLTEQIIACDEMIQNAKDEQAIWKGIYCRFMDKVLAIEDIDPHTREYLNSSVTLLNEGVVRAFEIDRAYSRLYNHPQRSEINTLYRLLDYNRRINHVHRRAVVLHRTLRKKENRMQCMTLMKEIEPQLTSHTMRKAYDQVRGVLTLLERDHISDGEAEEAHEAIQRLATSAPKLASKIIRLQLHVKQAVQIEKETTPTNRIYHIAFHLTRIAFTLLSRSSILYTLYRIVSSLMHLLPETLRREAYSALKIIARTIATQLFGGITYLFQWNEPFHVVDELRGEMNQYAHMLVYSRVPPQRTERQYCHFAPLERITRTKNTVLFNDYNLQFTLSDRAYSREYPGYFIDQHQFPDKLRRYGSYLLLTNKEGEQKIILPAADDASALSWHIRKHVGVLANPFTHLLPLIRSLASLSIRRGTRPYYCYDLDAKSRLASRNPEALAYLITVEFLHGKISSVVHAAEQLHMLLESSSTVSPDVEMMLWPLMVLPNTLSASVGIGPFNTLFRLRQKLLAALERLVDKAATPHNNSGLVHTIFIASLLQDLYARMKHGAAERTPWPLDDLDREEYLLYRCLHRHVEKIVSTAYHPVDWFEGRLLSPTMARRYRALYTRYAGAIPNPSDHFLRDCFHTTVDTPTRSYYGSAAAAPGQAPVALLGAISWEDSDRVEPYFWQRVHTIFRAHIDAVRNPHLDYAHLQQTLALTPAPFDLTKKALETHFFSYYDTALGFKGAQQRDRLFRTLKLNKGGWDLQSRTLIDLLTTVCSASSFREKPITSLSQPLWWAMRHLLPHQYNAFKWAGLHPLGLIATPIYGLVNHSIWNHNLTCAADRMTQLWGTGTNPPVRVTLFSGPCSIGEPGGAPTSQLTIQGTLHEVNKRLGKINVFPTTRICTLRIDLFAYLIAPSSCETPLLHRQTYDHPISLTTRELQFKDGEPLLRVPHPLSKLYNDAMDGWMSLDPKTFFPSPTLLATLIQQHKDPKAFFDYLHSKVHAYKIVHAYTRPMQRGMVWLMKNPLISVTGGKRAFYPIWAETIHKGITKAVYTLKEHYWAADEEEIEHKIVPPQIDFAEWLLDENIKFGRVFQHFKEATFEQDGSLKEGQPLVRLAVLLQHFNADLAQRIDADRKRLLATLNPSCITNRWRKPITYRELLLCFFTDNFEGIAKEQRFQERQVASLQTAIFRQIAREIRHEQLARLVKRIERLCYGRESPYALLKSIHDTLDSQFCHTRMPAWQRRLLCYEWLKGSVIQSPELASVISEVSDGDHYLRMVRNALIKA